jgi:hypothetical protein
MLLAVSLFASVAGCRQADPEQAEFVAIDREQSGPPRAFLLGFSALPAELTDESYLQSFDLAANYGELLLLQRTPSWSDFAPGADVSAELRDATMADRSAAEARGLELFVSLDPFDPAARGQLAALPAELVGADLTNVDLRAAFVAEAKYLATVLQPAYLSLGSEVNATYERDPAQYHAFVEAYAEAYEAVKTISPRTRVFVTFQFEQLLGVVPWEPPHPPRWELFDDFDERLDLLAITSYPSFTYTVARKVPPLYYRQIRDHTTLPVAFASVGYASAASRDGLNSSTPAEQRRFLQRLLGDADALASPLLVWFAARDPAFAAEPPFDLIASIGLRDSLDRPKEAWLVWEEASARPYAPEAAQELAGE